MKSSIKRFYTRRIARYIALLISLVASTAFAQIAPGVAEDLMRKSGLWKQLELMAPQLPAIWLATSTQPGVTLTEEQRTQMARSAEQAFAASALQQTARGVIASDIPLANVAQLMSWYASPLGQRLSKLEEAASAETDAAAAMAKGNSKLQSISADRRELLENFVVAIRGAEAVTDLLLNMNTAIVYGAALAAEPNTSIPLAEFRRTTLAARAEMLKTMHGVFLAITVTTYESVTDEELRKYTAFLGGPVGKHFGDVSLIATDRALVLAATAWGKAIVEGARAKRA
jgi:Uncharacterized protein conserved in bacteria (DUF2059)